MLAERASALTGLMQSNGGGRGADNIFGALSACNQNKSCFFLELFVFLFCVCELKIKSLGEATKKPLFNMLKIWCHCVPNIR